MSVCHIDNYCQDWYSDLVSSSFFRTGFMSTVHDHLGRDFDLLVDRSRAWNHLILYPSQEILEPFGAGSLHELRNFLFSHGHRRPSA